MWGGVYHSVLGFCAYGRLESRQKVRVVGLVGAEGIGFDVYNVLRYPV